MAKEIETIDIPMIDTMLQKVLGTSDYSDLRRMGGLTNHTYKVTFLIKFATKNSTLGRVFYILVLFLQKLFNAGKLYAKCKKLCCNNKV